MSLNIIQSHAFAHRGLLNAAGLFFSKKKCPDQANGYTTNGARRSKNRLFTTEYITKSIVAI